jgi:hypothetical protein
MSLCDFCCKGETGNVSNRLIVCSSCKVAVHLKCYGVQGDVNKFWLCSWCKQKSDDNDLVKQSCVLCPKEGGALKPVNVENGGSVLEFVHLFCSQWTPEVYIEDLTKMEPVMNVGGIKETRRKLVCNVCKVKSGTCVRCSHGMFCCFLILCHHAFIIFLWYPVLVSITTGACLAVEPVSNAAYKSYCANAFCRSS